MHIPVNPGADVYLFALLLALVSGFLFGMVPVRQVFKSNPYEIVKAGSSARIGRRMTVRDLLLVVQIAICAVLVTSSLVAVRGLARSLHSNFGFEPQDTLLVNTDLGMAGYPATDARHAEAHDGRDAGDSRRELRRAGGYPALAHGVEPLYVFSDRATDMRPPNAVAQAIEYRISPEYLQAAKTVLLAGRNFTWHDDKNAPRVAVVNREFARRIFANRSQAIGAEFKITDGTLIQVVGIVEDGKYTANLAEDPQPAMFLPILQFPASDTCLVVRSERDPQQLVAAIRSTLRDLDSGLPAFIQTWNEEMNGALFASRMATVSLGVLGVMGAMLSITGIFGMAAYSVSKRLRELGIRIALGAQRREVLHAALGRPFKLLAVGSAAGLVLGLLATRVLAYIVYQATPRDPLVLAGVVVAMVLLGLVATWIPAQRALSINPLILLRED